MHCLINLGLFVLNKTDIFSVHLFSLYIDRLSLSPPRNNSCSCSPYLLSLEYYHRQLDGEAFDTGLGQREMGSCGETVNVNLNRGDNVIISKSAEPSRLGGRVVDGHFPSRACLAVRPGA